MNYLKMRNTAKTSDIGLQRPALSNFHNDFEYLFVMCSVGEGSTIKTYPRHRSHFATQKIRQMSGATNKVWSEHLDLCIITQ